MSVRDMSMSLKSSLVVLGVALCLPAMASAQSSAAPSGHKPVVNLVAGPDAGPGIRPQSNNSAASPTVLLPDGTAVSDNNSDGVNQWFVAVTEGGKSYVLEVFHPYNDFLGNAILVDVFDSDGTTTWSSGVSDCNSAAGDTAAPSMQGSSDTPVGASYDGARCLLRPFTNNTPQTKRVFIKVTATFAGTFVVRMRENTVYARYTVNGYNMYVPVHNVSAAAVSGFVTFWGSDTLGTAVTDESSFNLQGYQSTQITRNAGTISPVTGTVRVILNGPATDVSVQAYAFNTFTNTFLQFVPERFNNVQGKSF